MPVYLTVLLKSNPAHTETLKLMLQDMVVQSKKEKACLQYDLHQVADNKSIFIFHETWESEEGLAAHEAQPYLKHFAATVPDLLVEPLMIYRTERV